MPVEIDVENLSISCTAETIWSELAAAARKEGFFVPVRPISERAAVEEWLMEDIPSMGVLGYGPPYSAIRGLKLTTGSGSGITTGYAELSDFSSSTNLSALLLGSRGELASLGRATFKLVPLGELRSISYAVPIAGLLPFVEEVLKGAPALYHIEFCAAKGNAAVQIIVEGAKELCHLAERKIDELAKKMGAQRGTARELYEAARGAGEWRVPLPVLRDAVEKLLAAGELAGIVERGCVRIKATPSEELSNVWGEKGYIMLQAREQGAAEAGLSARLKRVFDPDGRLCPKGKLAAAARKFKEPRVRGPLNTDKR